MFHYQLAYRHDNGEVEGFVGLGFTKANARDNAISQITTKIIDVLRVHKPETFFHPDRVIEGEASLTPAELEQVKQDWKTYYKVRA